MIKGARDTSERMFALVNGLSRRSYTKAEVSGCEKKS
jgi:hypothetical protein